MTASSTSLAPQRLAFALLRRVAPILVIGRRVIVSRHADCLEILTRDADFTIAEVNGERFDRVNGPFILGMDLSPQHDREYGVLRDVVRQDDLERIRRFVARCPEHGDVEAAIDAELTDPTPAMAASYAALEPEHRELLLAMLDSPPGPVAERDLAEALRRHARSPLPKSPVDLVDRLADHFLRVIA